MKSELDIANDLLQFIRELEVRIEKAKQALGCLTGPIIKTTPAEMETPPPTIVKKEIKYANTEILPMKKPHPIAKVAFCEECGKEFEPVRKIQRYCSRVCCQKVSNRTYAERAKKQVKVEKAKKTGPKPKHKPIVKQDSTEHTTIPKAAIKRGAVNGSIPVQINEKTVIFVKEGHDVEEVKRRYQNHVNHVFEEVKEVE